MFQLPQYYHPDFSADSLVNTPDVSTALCEEDGVVPEYFHSTSMFPEYFKVKGIWKLAEESRMDSCVILNEDGSLSVIEQRNVRKGQCVILGRSENGEEGIYVHAGGFVNPEEMQDKFSFRQGRSRETSFTKNYDQLYRLLEYERDNGFVVFVLGPACAFDYDSRKAMQSLIERGYVHGVLAGNALATHDLEAAYLKTALGQDIYDQKSYSNGHYNHLDVLNRVRRCGSIPAFIERYHIDNGIVYACIKKGIPMVLTSSIRDDGPLPEVIANAYEGQAKMREVLKKATTVICMATQLHTIASGNMIPSFRVRDGVIRPVYFYTVDISEFAVNKLSDRGSLSAVSIVTNVQDFINNVANGVQ